MSGSNSKIIQAVVRIVCKLLKLEIIYILDQPLRKFGAQRQYFCLKIAFMWKILPVSVIALCPGALDDFSYLIAGLCFYFNNLLRFNLVIIHIYLFNININKNV